VEDVPAKDNKKIKTKNKDADVEAVNVVVKEDVDKFY
tara:strand:+ start:22817 stop:22927 length:111 start_codon:yes stop_codon:yes gene_type:complete